MENNLKNLSRMELLQVLLQVTENNEALLAENAELKSAASMQISRSAKVGSIAEAALEANGFFEAAQRSADDYLREVKKLRDEMIERSKAQAAAQASQGASATSPDDELEQSRLFERIQDQAKTYIQDVQTYANNVMARANLQAQDILEDARVRSSEIIAQANDRARVIVEEAEDRAARKEASSAETALLAEHPEIELFVVEQPEASASQVEQLEFNASEEGVLETEQPAVDISEIAIPESDQPEDAAFSEGALDEGLLSRMEADSADVPDGPVAEPALADDASDEGDTDGESFTEAERAGNLLERGVEVQAAKTEESPAEELREATSQSTAPLNIDVIVSDIAASAFSEAELDPGSTGALVRRGRHVKIPEGMAM